MPNVLIFAGPSAIGKSFAMNMLVESFPDRFARVKVYTTRLPRSSESRAEDRIFVREDIFEQLVQDDQFGVHGYFAGNRYGYHKNDLVPTQEHLVTNAWIQPLPQLLQYKNTMVIGLQASSDYEDLLDARMIARGDTPEVRSARHALIKQEVQELEAMRPLIMERGKVFVVEDDTTIPTVVIPWILKKLPSANYKPTIL